ncbi:hypothetical protein [Chryseobacterium terrae]|uniref:Lipoprotein n=1 Tax=Chryseobacterium terrae TaxID=3163299 RepID=A0ABW8Y0P6_9FLAO
MKNPVFLYFLFPITFFLSCNTNKTKEFQLKKENIAKVEILINDAVFPLDSLLVNDFVNDLNKCKPDHTIQSIVYALDVKIYDKNTNLVNLKSNGSNAYDYQAKIFKCKENLFMKYWKINEESIPQLKSPEFKQR